MSRCGESGLANWPCQPGNCPRCGHGAEEGAWACEDAGQCLADQLRARLAEVEAERDRLRADALAEVRAVVAHVADTLEALGAPGDRLRRADVVAWLRHPVTAASKALADLQAELEGRT